jgi:rubredoxin
MDFACPKCGGWSFETDAERDIVMCNSDANGVPLPISSGSKLCGWKFQRELGQASSPGLGKHFRGETDHDER